MAESNGASSAEGITPIPIAWNEAGRAPGFPRGNISHAMWLCRVSAFERELRTCEFACFPGETLDPEYLVRADLDKSFPGEIPSLTTAIPDLATPKPATPFQATWPSPQSRHQIQRAI